ncbi:MAG: glycosyltransferase family 39 protein [Methylococcales bacterium]|nr:glycosyltransferase family 39 protein [Methylococcales bacterium]
MTRLQITYSLALLAGLGAAIIAYFLPIFPYTPDSACYIEQARSLIDRGAFESGLYGIEKPSVTFVPDPLFPPGYPILIALFSLLLSVSPEAVALFLSLTALALIPVCMVFSFRRVISAEGALIIGLLVVSTPAIIRWGNVASTDVLSVLLIIFCMGLVLKAGDHLMAWVVAGFLVGFAYLLRNANLAFVVSLCGLMAWSIVFGAENRRKRIVIACVWLLSFSTVTVPWMIRNLIVFGKIQPYSMPPSSVGFLENIHAFIEAQLNILLLLTDLDTFLARNILGIISLIFISGLLVRQVLKTWKHWQEIDKQAFIIAGLYCTTGAAIVILARTKYQWGELISERHTLPYLFSLLIVLALIFKNTTVKISRRWLGMALVSGLILTRIFYLPQLYKYNFYDANVVAVAEQIKKHQKTDPLCTNLNGRLGVSNYGFIYRVICAVPVRHVFPILHGDALNDGPLQKLLDVPREQGVVVSIFPNHDVDKDALPLNPALLNQLTSAGWRIEQNEQMGFIVAR